MTATSRAPRRPRIRPRGHAPPPTPIRTARGARSAAADERVLAEFLEASLRVPDLALPPLRKRSSFPPEPRDISWPALASGDAGAAVTAAAGESGAFRVAGAIDAREGVLEAASGAVFAAPEEARRRLGRWFRRRDDRTGTGGGEEEFLWCFRPACPDQERALVAALPASTYREFREKMDTVASKMEDVATTVMRLLSDNGKGPKASAQFREASSILCLKSYHGNCISKTGWSEFGCADPPDSHALSVHLCGRDRRICLRNQGGSTFFSLPAGSMLVTVGKQIQEWSNGQFRSAVAEVLFEVTDEPDPFISVELVYYSPDELRVSDAGRRTRRIDRPKIVSFRDQVLIALVLLCLLYLFWC